MATSRPERLDQILIRLGFATAAQVSEALRKQQGLGGRLGTHLVYAGHVTEQQLAQALSVQFQVPVFEAGRDKPSAELLERLPEGFARRHLVLPLALDEESGVLSLAAVDPRDTAAVGEVKRLLRCREVALCVIAEVTFEKMLGGLGLDDGGLLGPRRLIELPELFEGRADPNDPKARGQEAVAAADPEAAPRTLLVTERAFLRSFLAPLFEREGRELIATADGAEAAAALGRGGIDHILVADDMADAWRHWRAQGQVAHVRVPVTRLESVSGALLGAVAPYAAMQQSLLRALRLVAEGLGEAQGAPPAYDLLRRDVRSLAAALGLERLAVDGLEAAVLLVAPAAPPAANVDALLADDGTGVDWSRTLENAAAVGFPWRVESALAAMRQLLSERVNLDEFGRQDAETALAGQVLALTWHHHQRAGGSAGASGNRAVNLKAALRAKSGHLARSEVIEQYLALIERSEEDLLATAGHQVLVVGRSDRALRQLSTRLGHLGYRTLTAASFDEAAALCERQAPAAVFVHDASFPQDILRARERLTAGPRLLVYAVTTHADPAQVLNLFDAGFDDVFALPRDVDLVAARLRKALRAGAGAGAGEPVAPARPGSFQATFTAFAFTDLMQTLSQSLKSVRIELAGPGGEQAVVYLDRGQLVHAACGSLRGGEAVYRVIAWEDNGRFAVEPAGEFPEPNIGLPLESILMEGCRLLDESRI
ncbi:MAG: DUF4388 domain-containing protein [bacterium]|nr:DUF4388 domain-containing protein [bacterium]